MYAEHHALLSLSYISTYSQPRDLVHVVEPHHPLVCVARRPVLVSSNSSLYFPRATIDGHYRYGGQMVKVMIGAIWRKLTFIVDKPNHLAENLLQQVSITSRTIFLQILACKQMTLVCLTGTRSIYVLNVSLVGFIIFVVICLPVFLLRPER